MQDGIIRLTRTEEGDFVTDIYERARELTGFPIRAGWVLKQILELCEQVLLN